MSLVLRSMLLLKLALVASSHPPLRRAGTPCGGPRPALFGLRGGSSPSPTASPTASAEIAAPELEPLSQILQQLQKLQPVPSQRPPRWPAGSGVVILLLYAAGLVNGLARRTLSCAAPLLDRNGLLPKSEVDQIAMLGYQSFAFGRLLAAPLILRLGSVRALLIQLLVLSFSCAGFCAASGAPRVQAACWALVRMFSAMTMSIMLPLVRAWIPRRAYGRVWALLQSGVQTGGLLAYALYGRQLSRGTMRWRSPFLLVALSGVLLAAACALLLRARPNGPRPSPSASSSPPPPPPAPGRLLLPRGLLKRFAAKPQFWLMLVAVAAYTPIYEAGTFMSNYLKQLGGEARDAAAHCIEDAACAPRVGLFQLGTVVSLLLGSVVYDRSSQFDKALLVACLMGASACCWGALFLADLPTPQPPPPPLPAGVSALWRQLAASLVGAGEWAAPPPAARASASAAGWAAARLPRLRLSVRAKTIVAALAAATMALPTSLPFAVFAMDFGKEGAAYLASLLSAVGFCGQLLSLRLLPRLQRAHGWHACHATLAALGSAAAVAMSAVMFADQRKMARGYIIRSSLFNETVVTLHACARPSCRHQPMWRPGALRPYASADARGASGYSLSALKGYAPTRRCHICGRSNLVECKVGEAFAGLALLEPFNHSLAQGRMPRPQNRTPPDARGRRAGRRRKPVPVDVQPDDEPLWVREVRPLRKPADGWKFADPSAYPVAEERSSNWRSSRARAAAVAPPQRAGGNSSRVDV